MPKALDIAGQKFSRLLAVRSTDLRSNGGKVVWEFKCDCGSTHLATAQSVKSGNTSSCGCLNIESIIKRNTSHGFTRRGKEAPEYNVWHKMKRRCHDPMNPDWHAYGGRGISVCERWRFDFAAFMADMGPRPSDKHSIDRIDNDGNYEPSNCRWTTQDVQSKNTRVPRHSSTKVKGVTRLGPSNYIARITVNGQRLYLGYFSSVSEAAEARRKAEEEHWIYAMVGGAK